MIKVYMYSCRCVCTVRACVYVHMLAVEVAGSTGGAEALWLPVGGSVSVSVCLGAGCMGCVLPQHAGRRHISVPECVHDCCCWWCGYLLLSRCGCTAAVQLNLGLSRLPHLPIRNWIPDPSHQTLAMLAPLCLYLPLAFVPSSLENIWVLKHAGVCEAGEWSACGAVCRPHWCSAAQHQPPKQGRTGEGEGGPGHEKERQGDTMHEGSRWMECQVMVVALTHTSLQLENFRG